MAMNGNEMAAVVLQAMGGRVTQRRQREFEAMCTAIVQYIQTHAQVTVVGVTSGPNTVVTPPPCVL